MICQHLEWRSVRREQLNPLLARQVVSGDKVMLAQVFLQKGSVVPPHSHESEQISYILRGVLRFDISQPNGSIQQIDVRAGEVLVIPSNVVHGAVALEDTVDLDVFSPIRHDWLDGADQYLRG